MSEGDNDDAATSLDRRCVLAATAACLAPALLPGAAWAEGADDLPAKGDQLVAGDGSSKTPLTTDSVKVGAELMTALAMSAKGVVKSDSRFSKLLLFRFDDKDIADDVRSLTVDGIMAFSAICTHQGCELSAWEPATDKLTCFCHGSVFLPAKGGDVAHGPASKRLPMLPLAKNGNTLVVAADFTAPPGPPAKTRL